MKNELNNTASIHTGFYDLDFERLEGLSVSEMATSDPKEIFTDVLPINDFDIDYEMVNDQLLPDDDEDDVDDDDDDLDEVEDDLVLGDEDDLDDEDLDEEDIDLEIDDDIDEEEINEDDLVLDTSDDIFLDDDEEEDDL